MSVHRLRGGTRPWTRALGGVMAVTLAVVATLDLVGCRASRPSEKPEPGALSVDLAVIPLILPADTTKSATVWVTVLEGSEPVADSTKVWLVATAGTLPSEVYTSAGLANTNYRPSRATGVVMIIAQVKGVRDTMNITVY